MNQNLKALTIPHCLMHHPSLDCTERVLLAHIAEHPDSSDHQLAQVARLGLALVEARIRDLCHREHLHQATHGGARKLTVVALELDRAQAVLTGHGLTCEAAGDTLLALFELGQIRLGATKVEGRILKQLGLSSLGCALLLESAMLRKLQDGRAAARCKASPGAAGIVDQPQPALCASADTGSAPVGGESTGGANWIWHEADRHSAVAQLAAVLEAQVRELSTQTLGERDKRCLEAACGSLKCDEWDDALTELEDMKMEVRLHPEVLAVAVQAQGAVSKSDHTHLLSLILLLLAPDRVESWLAAATAARHATSAGANSELITLLKASHRHPRDWRLAYQIACFFCRQGDLAGTREFLALAEEQGGSDELEMMIWEEPDLEAYQHEMLKDEPDLAEQP